MRVTCPIAAALVFTCALPCAAQVTGAADAPAAAVTTREDRGVTPNEDVEPRVIATPGTMAVGLSGSADRISSADDDLPLNLTLQVDVSRFLTRRIAVRGGIVGAGAMGGDPDDLPAGVGVPALHAFGAAAWYFTPQAMASVYAGAGYWAQLTGRDGPDRGSVLALGGVEAAVSARATLFVEGGWGAGLTRTDDGATRTRFLARLGVRIKL